MGFLSLLLLAPLAVARRPVPEHEINLDLAPEHRYDALIPFFNDTVWKFYTDYIANDAILATALYALSDARGPEPEEMQREIDGMVRISNLPAKFVKGIQMLYELQTLMVPVENMTVSIPQISPLPQGWEAFANLPWRGPGCTGIIATDNTPGGGTVFHARNLDFSPKEIMRDLAYTAKFTRGGKEVFRSQMIAGYACIVTGMKMGENGFTLERNTRYPDHVGGNEEMAKQLVAGRPLNGWSLRKIMEESADYEIAVAAVMKTPYVSTEYAIMSGVKKGVIISKDPDSVAHVQTLGEPNFECRDDYIIITNFDFFFHDFREWFDPTGGTIGKPRRIEAQKILNGTDYLTGEALFETINAKGVIAGDTIFQAIMNVETGLYNVSLPV